MYQESEKNADFQINLNNSRENGVSLHQNSVIMRYRIKKETKPTLPTFGKYKAVAVHNQVIELCDEAASRGMAISGGVLEGLLMAVGETMMRHLQMGDKVRLKNFGLFKLEIESEKVDDPKTFRAKKHIRGVRLHFIPESYEGSQPLYEGITYEKEK